MKQFYCHISLDCISTIFNENFITNGKIPSYVVKNQKRLDCLKMHKTLK